MPIYCIHSISKTGVIKLIDHMGNFVMYSHVSVLEKL